MSVTQADKEWQWGWSDWLGHFGEEGHEKLSHVEGSVEFFEAFGPLGRIASLLVVVDTLASLLHHQTFLKVQGEESILALVTPKQVNFVILVFHLNLPKNFSVELWFNLNRRLYCGSL